MWLKALLTSYRFFILPLEGGDPGRAPLNGFSGVARVPGDYAANVRLGSDVPTISALKNPAATPYVQDTVIQDSFGEWISGKGFSKKKEYQSFAGRHAGSGNIRWVDGHVSSFKHAEYLK